MSTWRGTSKTCDADKEREGFNGDDRRVELIELEAGKTKRAMGGNTQPRTSKQVPRHFDFWQRRQVAHSVSSLPLLAPN